LTSTPIRIHHGVICLLSIFLLLTASCEDGSTQPAVPAPETASRAIAWHEGDINSAFKQSSESGKPVFFYWGAEWCPPCQEIKHTVFKSPEFIDQSTLFIPVYLDGDTAQAQRFGEELGVQGYPTMIVFDPNGNEVTRIPGGIDISQYNTVLATSLESLRPAATIIDLVLNDPDALTANDYVQLAYYSWGQESDLIPKDVDRVALFRKMAELAEPEDADIGARLFMSYLLALTEQGSDEESTQQVTETTQKPDQSSQYVVTRIEIILADPELTLACWDSLAYYSEEILDLAVFSDSDRKRLKPLWAEAIFALRNSANLTTAEQLGGWFPRLIFLFEDEAATLPDAWAKILREELQAADQRTTNPYARQSIINQINHVYQQAGLIDDARALLLAELDKSALPYYFMSSLSALAEDANNKAEAISWRQKAYESSTGDATRFQWGASYVRSLVRLAPEKDAAILAASSDLLHELADAQALFSGRNFRVLRTLQRELVAWEKAHNTDLSAFTDYVTQSCTQQAVNSLESTNCLSLQQDDS
jgi:thioredoxin-related protein